MKMVFAHCLSKCTSLLFYQNPSMAVNYVQKLQNAVSSDRKSTYTLRQIYWQTDVYLDLIHVLPIESEIHYRKLLLCANCFGTPSLHVSKSF